MTLEEKALEVLENSELNTPQHDLTVISKTMAGFAREHLKAKLEEAAENMDDAYIIKHIDRGKHEDGSPSMDEQAYYEGAKWMRKLITKTPLD